jgi:predicted PurR-regulated permease PerM
MATDDKRGRIFFYSIFAGLAVLTFLLIRPFISAIAIALITIVLLRPVYSYLMKKKWVKGRRGVATTLTIVIFFLLIIIPLLILGTLTVSQIRSLIELINSGELEKVLEDALVKFEEFSQQVMTSLQIDEDQLAEGFQDLARGALNWVSNLAISLGASLPDLFFSAIIFLSLLATLLPATDDLNKRLKELSPLDVTIYDLYLIKAKEMTISVVKGIFLLTILQGLLMGVFYWIAGIPFAFFWTLMSIVFGVMPVVGISFVAVPIAIVAAVTGNTTAAIIVLIGFYVFVNPLDLILRPRLVSKEAYLNFTLMLLALFGGLKLAGMLGMIYGPVIMILFLTTVGVYAERFVTSDEPETAALLAGGESETSLEVTGDASERESNIGELEETGSTDDDVN